MLCFSTKDGVLNGCFDVREYCGCYFRVGTKSKEGLNLL